MHTGAGTDVEHIIGGSDHALVVFDHQHGVADVGQVPEGSDEAVVVTLVQADRRFIEHVADADEAGADLGGQSDALRFSARERVRSPVQ